MLTDEAMQAMNSYAKDGKALRSTMRSIIKDLTRELATLQQQSAELQHENARLTALEGSECGDCLQYEQQNRQMRETLEWIDEYRELNMTIAMNEWEEAAAFKAVEDRVTATLQSLQDT